MKAEDRVKLIPWHNGLWFVELDGKTTDLCSTNQEHAIMLKKAVILGMEAKTV